MAHVVSNTQPPLGGALGDEWFNPTTNKLYKLVAVNGTSVSWQDTGLSASQSSVLSTITAGQNISISANGVISSTITAGQYVNIAANGQINANITAGQNITISNVGVISGLGAGSTIENTFTSRQNYTGNTTATAVKFWNMAEQMSLPGIIPGSTGNTIVQIDLANAAVYYFTTAATNNWTVNFRMSSSTLLNSGMGNSESVSAVVMVTQGTTPYYANITQIDGVTIIPKWQDGLVPVTGNASAVDVYNYTIIKTANATYTVLGSQSKFA